MTNKITLRNLEAFTHPWLLLLLSRSVVSDSLPTHGLHHAWLPYLSLYSRVCSISCPLSWWCHSTISSSVAHFCSCPQSFPTSGSFPMSRLFTSVTKVLELQRQSLQWIFRVDFLLDRLFWAPFSPRDSQESSPPSQFESINSLARSLLYGPALTPVHDYWENHSFD